MTCDTFPGVAVDRRAELIEAGISLLSQRRFQDLMADVETRTIVDEVGVTTGSFFHHFRTRSHVADAVVVAFVAAWETRVAHLEAASRGFSEGKGAGGVRPAVDAEWETLQDDDGVATLQHLLWAVRDQQLADDTSRTAGEVLRGCYDHLTARVEEPYQDALVLMGREMLPPFTSHDLTVIMTAFEEGMQMRRAVDAGAVRSDLYADTIAAILLGVTRPIIGRSESSPAPDLASLEARFLVRRHDAADSPEEVWRHIADAAAHLFVDRSAQDVRVAEVAAAAGVSPQAVLNQFGTVSAVAAAGWARHLPELEAIATAPLTEEEGPIRRIEQVLRRGVELTRENRGAAEALLAQVVAEARPTTGPREQRSIRETVPLAGLLVPLVQEVRAAGLLRRRMDVTRLARSLVQVATMQALVFTEESPARVVDETMTLAFDGALVGTSDD